MSSYEVMYKGVDYLIPKTNPIGYQESIQQLGMSTDPRTANQLKEINVKLNPGMKHIEVGALQGSVMESIPNEHLDEIRRLGKLTGVSTSLHAPLVEASGVGERGFDDLNRVGAEQQLESALLRANKLDPKGNVVVTTHTTAQLPEMMPTVKMYNPETKKVEEKLINLWVINPETGKYNMLQAEKRYFPKEGAGEFTPEKIPAFNPEEELKKVNNDAWTDQLSNVNRLSAYGEDILNRVEHGFKIPKETFATIAKAEEFEKILPEHTAEKEVFNQAQREIIHGQIYLRDAYKQLKDMFDRAWIGASREVQKGTPLANQAQKDLDKLRQFADKYAKEIQPGMEKDPEKLQVLGKIVEDGIRVLRDIRAPNTFVPLQDFAIEKASETFGNVATSSYKKFKDNAPILSIENPPSGMNGLSTGEDLKNVVKASRKVMENNLIKEGMSEAEAKRVAEKFIGATWDVGHINMIRKKGYTEEDVIKESEKIAPYVKHVHLSDNFGLDHTELPMGMGNVPMKEIMKKLGQKGFEGKKIIEAGNWWQFFAEQGGGNPFKPSIQNFDSPIYTMKEGYTWSQLGNYAGYFSGHGPVNPAIHHQTYGSGFQNLPMELGGEIPGQQSRFAGTPNQ